MGHRQVCHSDWFVLDLTGRHCLVLVQVERARDHSFRGLLVRLVAAWGSGVGVLVAAVGVVLVLELAGSAPAGASPSATTSAPAARREALGLLGGHCCCHCQRVRVVLPHVFH